MVQCYELISEKAATCTEDGEKVYKCSVCGDTKTEIINKKPHDYVTEEIEPTCTEPGYTLYICMECGESYLVETTPTTGHDYKAISVLNATCTVSGEIVYKCTKCGHIKAEQTAPLGHEYAEPYWVWESPDNVIAIITCVEGDDEITLEAAVDSELTADKVIYTASITFNGKQYTDTYETARQFNLKFVCDDVQYGTEQTVEYGDTAAKPVDPVKEHYTFVGWYVNGKEFDFSLPVTDDMVFTAEWEADKYRVNISEENCKITVKAIMGDDEYTVVPDGGEVAYGTELIYEVQADNGYYLGTDRSNGNKAYTCKTSDVITAYGDISIEERAYIKNFRLSAVTYEGGYAPIISGNDYAPYNGYVTVTAGAAYEGYSFAGWYRLGECLSTDEVYQMQMTSSTYIYAKYLMEA